MTATGATPKWYSTQEVALLLGVSDQAIRNAAESGRLTRWRREGSGGRVPYRFEKREIDGLNGELPSSRPRRLAAAGDTELVGLIDRLRREAETHRMERALADQKVIELEREVERLQGALRDLVGRFTRPELPDLPGLG